MRSQKSYFSEIHFGLDFLLYMFLKPELLQFIVIKPELTRRVNLKPGRPNGWTGPGFSKDRSVQ
jgi:hypothetical protein